MGLVAISAILILIVLEQWSELKKIKEKLFKSDTKFFLYKTYCQVQEEHIGKLKIKCAALKERRKNKKKYRIIRRVKR
ncbi:hypothetical protein [Fusobacterium varium]|jgi:hypothetical protein|nr:MAG TPA: hypothetical protein [Caudoviricetes sp.]